MLIRVAGYLAILLFCCALAPVWAQADPPAAPPPDQFFSGNITALESGKITVSRTVLGKDSVTRTFLITPETKIEGKPRLKARVTVRFVRTEEGDKALHIIVRAATPKK